MSGSADNIRQLLSPFGLSIEESDIYLQLLEKGFLSALKISHETGLARTKVYRVLDKLIEKRLVEQKLDGSGMRFGATDPGKFKQLVTEKEHAVASLKESLPDLLTKLEAIAARKSNDTKVLYYKGVEGLKQITYNSTRAKDTLRIYETSNDMSDFLPQDFSEEMRRLFVRNKVHIQQLTWNKYTSNYTEVSEMVTDFHETRYLGPESLKMKSEVLIYNDVYVMYNPVGPDLFGVEIYNADLANMQRQLFDMTWAGAKKMKKIDQRGAVSLDQE